MADTGAPWNIPYVENADLVKDYPTASLALANAIDAGLDSANSPVAQIVSTIKTDTFSEAVAATAVTGDITGLTATLTPAATSTLLITVQVNFAITTTIGGLILYRDGSPVAVGDAASSRRQTTTTRQDGMTTSETSVTTIHALVAAGAAASTTFSVRIANASGGSGTAYVNRSATDANGLNDFRGSSTISVMEIKA